MQNFLSKSLQKSQVNFMTQIRVLKRGSVRFGSARFDSVRLGSARFGSVRLSSTQFDSVRLGSGSVSIQLDSARIWTLTQIKLNYCLYPQGDSEFLISLLTNFSVVSLKTHHLHVGNFQWKTVNFHMKPLSSFKWSSSRFLQNSNSVMLRWKKEFSQKAQKAATLQNFVKNPPK